MARERIYIYDTTLRDGQQTPGVDFSVEDKKSIVVLLEELGVNDDKKEAPPAPIPHDENE